MERLYMTQPYEADDQLFYVRRDSPVQDPRELSGKKVGACADCSHQLYLEGTLEIPGVEIAYFLDDPEIVLFDVERSGLEAVEKGEIAAFICSSPVGDEAIEDGLALRALTNSPFPLYSSGFVDRSSGLSSEAFVARIDEIVQRLHADGTLKSLSMKYLGKDFATKAGEFDIGSIGQSVT
jgi:polar amino acid transport system substrate-binding protein